MKQKNYIIKLLLKTWLGILCFSLLCTFCAVWLLFQNTKQSSYDNINIVYEGIVFNLGYNWGNNVFSWDIHIVSELLPSNQV